MTRLPKLERGVLAIGLLAWPVAALFLLGRGPWRGLYSASLYQYFAFASILGWVAGNLCVLRRRGAPPDWAKRLVWLYLFCPPAILFLARGLAATPEQLRAPFAPLYAVAVYAIFFALPLSFRKNPKG